MVWLDLGRADFARAPVVAVADAVFAGAYAKAFKGRKKPLRSILARLDRCWLVYAARDLASLSGLAPCRD